MLLMLLLTWCLVGRPLCWLGLMPRRVHQVRVRLSRHLSLVIPYPQGLALFSRERVLAVYVPRPLLTHMLCPQVSNALHRVCVSMLKRAPRLGWR